MRLHSRRRTKARTTCNWLMLFLAYQPDIWPCPVVPQRGSKGDLFFCSISLSQHHHNLTYSRTFCRSLHQPHHQHHRHCNSAYVRPVSQATTDTAIPHMYAQFRKPQVSKYVHSIVDVSLWVKKTKKDRIVTSLSPGLFDVIDVHRYEDRIFSSLGLVPWLHLNKKPWTGH